MIEHKNCFYFRYISLIGGIETFFYYLAKKYKNQDIAIIYSEGDYKQIKRISQYVPLIKYKGQKIKCGKMFFNFNIDIIDNVEAKEYIQIAHGDYKSCNIKPNTHPKITKYLGISKVVCDTYKEVTGLDTELCYNPIAIDEPKKVLNLISATRLTYEKGKDRMIKLAEMLDKAQIPYLWTIFTDDTKAIDNPNIIYMKPRLDIINYIANADYLVQLSDSEGYCYSVAEALSVGTPVIVTNTPVMKEIGVNSTNGFILDFDLSNVDLKAIYKGLPKFTYTPKKDNYSKLLSKSKSTYEPNKKVKVKCIQDYNDIELNKEITKGCEYELPFARASYLQDEECVVMIDG